jgi:hypothetical protein
MLQTSRRVVGFVLPKSITEDRAPHQIIFGRYDELNLAPFQGDSPGWMRFPGLKPRAESLNRFAVNPTDS